MNERQERLIELLSDPLDPRPKKAKSLAAGYKSETQVFKLQRDPEFRKALLERMRALVGANLPAVFARLFAIAERGRDKDAIHACDLLLKAGGEIVVGGTNVITNVRTAPQPGARTVRDPDSGELREETLEEAMRRVAELRKRPGGAKPPLRLMRNTRAIEEDGGTENEN